MIDDAALRERLAAEGRARVERLFDLRRVAATLDDFCFATIERANRLGELAETVAGRLAADPGR